MSESNMLFKQPDEKEFEQIKQHVDDLWLYNEGMKPEQFRVLSDSGKVIAFGRLMEHVDATELCTLGVAKEFQGKGWGSKMVQHLLDQAKRDVYIVTTILKFNSNLGFIYIEQYPKSIKRKLETCVKHYHVDEPYFVMKYEKKQI